MKTIITVTYKYTSSVLDALAESGNFNYDWNYNSGSGKNYICQGYRFNSTRDFCDWMISEITGWMLDNNQASLEPIKKAVYASNRYVKCFYVTQEQATQEQATQEQAK